MNSPKAVIPLGFTLILSVLLTACGGSGKTPPPPSPPTIQTATLPQGAVNTPYFNGGATLSATGGTKPYTWNIASGSLPPGLTLNGAQGVISGTPTTLGNYSFTVQVTDAKGLSSTQPLSIYIEGVVVITPAVLPTGTPSVPYTNSNGTPVQLTATGGLAPYTWCVVENSTCDTGTGGALPPGLSLSTSGTISGMPTTPGIPATFTVQVSDSETAPGVPAVGSANFSITVMSIVTTSVPVGYLKVPYSATLTVAGGIQPYSWTASNLPAGLSLDPACTGTKLPTCAIKGTPTASGVFAVKVQVMDGEKLNPVPTATATLNLTIYSASPLMVTTTSLPTGIVGLAYSTTLAVSGGTPPFTWSLASGALPAGLSLDPNSGVISGTPTMAGTSSPFTVQVADSGSPQQTATSATLSIVINAALTNANLSGNYVFTFSGFKNGAPVMMAGSFVADGSGNITSGLLDYNDGTGEPPYKNPTPQTIGAGSVYNITPNGLGTMTLVTNLSPPSPFRFNLSIRSDGSGRLIQSDPSQLQAYGSGEINATTPLAQNEQFPLCGSSVAVGLFGVDNSLSTRYAAAGQFQFNPKTCVDFAGGVMNINDGGTASSATFSGALNQFDNTNSRGYVGITFNSNVAHTYAFYLVSSSDRKQNELVLVSTDPASQPAPLTLWSVLQQPNLPRGWDNSYLAGTSVAELNALDTSTGPVDVTAGLFVGQGVSGHTCTSGQGGSPQLDPATLNYDENQGGTSSLQQTSSGTYCVDKTTGRVTVTAFNTGPFAMPPVFYMVKGGQAFVVGTDPAVTSGSLEQQMGSSFSNSSVSGSYAGGTVAPITKNVTNAVAWLLADGSGNIYGYECPQGYTCTENGSGQQPKFTYTYTVNATTGRTIVQQNGATIGITYVISPTKFALLPTTDPNPALSIFGQ